ncbi:hypothetical protein WJX73_003872 [Symbiochloris irregularis]|uniref:Uncharacterized protein n=1 Tax=Symbiochloris irregularis TaxID=706552 RepID=A0AAW1PJ53_9CHLO
MTTPPSDLDGKLDEIQLAISASADPQTRAYLEGLLGQIRSAIAKRLEQEATEPDNQAAFSLSQPEPDRRQAYHRPKPYSAVELAVPEESVHNERHAHVQQIADYSNTPLYSEWLAQNLGLKAPFEQYGFYLAGILGVSAFLRRGACARYLRSMHHLGQAAAASSSRTS